MSANDNHSSLLYQTINNHNKVLYFVILAIVSSVGTWTNFKLFRKTKPQKHIVSHIFFSFWAKYYKVRQKLLKMRNNLIYQIINNNNKGVRLEVPGCWRYRQLFREWALEKIYIILNQQNNKLPKYIYLYSDVEMKQI